MLVLSKELMKKDDLKEITQHIINGFALPEQLNDQLKDEKFCAGVICAMQLCLTSDHCQDSREQNFNSLVVMLIEKIITIHKEKLKVEFDLVPSKTH